MHDDELDELELKFGQLVHDDAPSALYEPAGHADRLSIALRAGAGWGWGVTQDRPHHSQLSVVGGARGGGGGQRTHQSMWCRWGCSCRQCTGCS